ncbi:helix-turn-helix domain-containing protein [Streptomyces tauricus]|uniref:helix-turn-helix domain-containing protein n=1 Tax=Streptomyces tauricus TaxID=68274 RepID=UPI0033B01017
MLAVGDDRPDAPGHLTEVEAVVRRHVREHAAEPGLTGTSMARALGWSLRQIQLALQRVGTTPRELIREERLRLVRDRLRCGECEHMTITDLAYASGFSSERAQYGVSAAVRGESAGDAGGGSVTVAVAVRCRGFAPFPAPL